LKTSETQGFGFFSSAIFCKALAITFKSLHVHLGISANNASILLVLLQLSASISRVAFAVLSDTFETFTLMSLSSAASALVAYAYGASLQPLRLSSCLLSLLDFSRVAT
jgi:sugar phosphate permease